MDLNQMGSIASIISLVIAFFSGAGIMHIYHVKIKSSIVKKNKANTLINSGSIKQEIR